MYWEDTLNERDIDRKSVNFKEEEDEEIEPIFVLDIEVIKEKFKFYITVFFCLLSVLR